MHSADVGKEESESLLRGGENGRFLIRRRPKHDDQFVLSLMYKGNPTQHLIKPDDDGSGNLMINKKVFGGGVSSIDALVKVLAANPKGWPAPLTEYVDAESSNVVAWGAESSGRETSSSPSRNPPPSTPVTPPPWLHGTITRDEADALIRAQGMDNGRFLVRTHNIKDKFALCVVYRGKPTHHLIEKNSNGYFCVNKKQYGGDHTTLAAAVNALKADDLPGWPVPLSLPVSRAGSEEGGGGGGGGGGSGSASTATASTAGASAGTPSWLHPATVDKAEADAKLAAAGLDDGRFFARSVNQLPRRHSIDSSGPRRGAAGSLPRHPISAPPPPPPPPPTPPPPPPPESVARGNPNRMGFYHVC